mgnify:CR=1 FL=1
MTRTRQLADAGQSVWLDNIAKRLITDDTLAGYIRDLAVTGVVTYASHTRPLNLIALPYLAETYAQGWRLYDNSQFIAAQRLALLHIAGKVADRRLRPV